MQNFEKTLLKTAKNIDKALKKQLSLIKNTPQIIIDAMAYSLMAGGKRVRPVLLTWTAEAFGLTPKAVEPAACAVEMLHTYSLIHDDLPSMDNDSLRRGKPTNHIIFGQDTALLAGDSLLTYAFETLARNGAIKEVGPERTLKAVQSLSHYGGVSGMIGGQVADVFAEGILEGKSKRASLLAKTKFFKGRLSGYYLLPKKAKEVSAAALLKYIHTNKTGALIKTSVEMGALLAGAKEQDLKNIRTYAEAIGFAFQVADDILDATKTQKQLGKSNSDLINKKLTFVTLYGLEEAKKAAQKALKDAVRALDKIKSNKLKPLYDMAYFIIERTY